MDMMSIWRCTVSVIRKDTSEQAKALVGGQHRTRCVGFEETWTEQTANRIDWFSRFWVLKPTAASDKERSVSSEEEALLNRYCAKNMDNANMSFIKTKRRERI